MPIRLTELAPAWTQDSEKRQGQGLSFLCPCCRKMIVHVSFTNPVDGGPPYRNRRRLFERTGDEFDKITVRPAIDRDHVPEAHWHGRITDGEVSTP